ncbi:MAG: WD40/YVTN/BNR-like repeat-containing protein [Pyrinomonadaceae bacterium]
MAKDKPKRKKAAPTKAGRSQSGSPRKGVEESAEQTGVVLSSVPRRKGKGHSVRLTSHKARSRWFQSRASWPVREAPVNRLLFERLRVAKSLAEPRGVSSIWECVGPMNIGGRITSLACHPKHPERIWTGAAGGGVWQSKDGGENWASCWNDQDILNIGSLAIDPKNPDTIYCGTGEANLSLDSYPGVGLYCSKDAGRTWQLLASTERSGVPRGIGVIAIDPFDSKHLLIGGVGFGEVSYEGKSLGGLYSSFDRGVSWERETLVSEQNYWCHSIVFHPTKKRTIFATFTEQGARSGIWRTTDGGKHWTHLSRGLPPPALFGRTSLAISPSKPQVIYAIAADESSESSDLMLGVYRSADGGETWKDISRKHFAKEGQMSYGNTIVVHPRDPNYVICGGVDLHCTTDAGDSWRRITQWELDRGKPRYAHSDHHALLMPAAVPGLVYSGNDGGVDRSYDGGSHWTNCSNDLAVTMFYDLDVAPSNGDVFGGGAQDNGTIITKNGAPTTFFQIYEGDGGWIVFDPQDPNHVYCSVYNLDIRRFHGKVHKDVSPRASAAERASVWMCFITLHPSDSKTVFTGSYRVWRTEDDGEKWTAVSPKLDGSPISAIEVAPQNPKRVYVATENGGFFRSRDGGDKWSPNLSSSTLPGHTITRLESHPDDADLVYATVANFGHSHVFRTKDGGLTWVDVDLGQLPDVPHHAVVIRNDELDKVYVANDAGVFVLDTASGVWMNLTKNLPNAMVVDLVYHEKDGTLNAATYGRSIWRLKMK